MYDFLFVVIELFSLALTGGRGRRPPTTVGWQKTIRTALSCGIKILPVGSLD